MSEKTKDSKNRKTQESSQDLKSIFIYMKSLSNIFESINSSVFVFYKKYFEFFKTFHSYYLSFFKCEYQRVSHPRLKSKIRLNYNVRKQNC